MVLTHSMSKAELVLAQKTFAANKIKWENKNLNKSGASSSKRYPGLKGSGSSSSGVGGDSSSSAAMGTSSGPSTMFSPMKPHDNGNGSGAHSPQPQTQQQTGGMRKINVQELGERGLTSATGLRKTNLMVSQAVNAKKGKIGLSDPEKLLEELSRENYYLPKVVITRPDGATLMDIYRSKQSDTWSRILKAQIKEEEEKKIQDKIDRERANEKFGRLLRADLAIIANRDGNLGDDDAKLAAITEATSKRADDVQRKRRMDAVTRQKQFINYALTDIDTKAQKRARELEREIEASTMMINKVKAEMAMDEKLKADKKAAEALRLEKLYIENQESLKRKEEIKIKQFAEDKRIFREAELRAQREDKRRADHLASKTKQATDGPAHGVAAAIGELAKKKEEELYKTLMDAGNMLNKQLQNSEDCKFEKSLRRN